MFECPSTAIANQILEIAARIPGSDVARCDPDSPNRLRIGKLDREDLPSLVNRLGWPPPDPIVARWLDQLDRWQTLLQQHNWPLNQGGVEDLSIDAQGELHWDMLPVRIVQSTSFLNSSNGEPTAGSTMERIRRLIEYNPGTSGRFQAGSTSILTPILTPAPVIKKKRQKRTSRRQSWTLMGVGVVIVSGLALWLFLNSTAPAPTRVATPELSPGSAALFSAANSTIHERPASLSDNLSEPDPKLQSVAEIEIAELELPRLSGSMVDLISSDFDVASIDRADPVAADLPANKDSQEPNTERSIPEPIALGIASSETIEWELDPSVNLQKSLGSLQIVEETIAAGLEHLAYRWLSPHEDLAGRKMNALLEIRLEDESPVVIRFRFDLKVARQAKLDTKWIVSVDPAMGWQRIDENTLLASIDRAIELKQRLQQQFQAADLQIDQAVDSDLRRILRLSRKQLEQQRTQAETYLQRLNQLQTLLSRTMRELRIQATVGN